MMASFLTTNLLIAWSAYFIGAASPGPSNLAIMSIATTSGRRAALVFAGGVLSGSVFWASLATLGLSAALVAWSGFLSVAKVLGGLYLLWLAFKSGRAALKPAFGNHAPSAAELSNRRLYLRGALLQFTNPKTILVWISVVALASPAGGGSAHMLTVVAGCLSIAFCVFGGYALLFSTAVARRLYLSLRRWLDGCLAVAFGVAGYRLLTSR
ncbi:Threonine/homoserine/homoserine lactone efflux protein [Cupriavidus sp. YR651]|uniref:LysE family translocator n=1 Tax=Cupriavidus sp. YR651 TaxID=1855315 RepID=UPI0008854FC1|nr:LysE family translocator [Cupriavidus sp. YR651]SDD52184.1 Threonine/homoserine/homoserine lactone efflux protein [Cupriavidus sp. YR651]